MLVFFGMELSFQTPYRVLSVRIILLVVLQDQFLAQRAHKVPLGTLTSKSSLLHGGEMVVSDHCSCGGAVAAGLVPVLGLPGLLGQPGHVPRLELEHPRVNVSSRGFTWLFSLVLSALQVASIMRITLLSWSDGCPKAGVNVRSVPAET